MNKILLAAIALGLWANAATSVIKPARADDGYGYQIYNELRNIHSTLVSIHSELNGTLNVNCRSGCSN
jgi:hypothetical protein